MDGNITFTRLPTKLIDILDSDLLKMLALLIRQEDYWRNHKKLGADGSFYKPIKEFAASFRKKNYQDVRLILQTLQAEGFISILQSKGGKQANYYRICWDYIATFNDKKIPQLLNEPMIKTAKRTSKKKVEDSTKSYQSNENIGSTELYYQSIEDSTETYQQDSDLIVQDCTSTIDNIININNNITKDNIEFTKSPLYEPFKTKIEEMIADYINESDYINALDKYSNIEGLFEVATKHIPTTELEIFKSQLTEASLVHERKGWNIKLDRITDDMIQQYHYSNEHIVKTPNNYQQFSYILNDTIGRIELNVSDSLRGEYTEKMEKWITHQWSRGAISYDCMQESIKRLYSRLAS